jgi:hypothetical protein
MGQSTKPRTKKFTINRLLHIVPLLGSQRDAGSHDGRPGNRDGCSFNPR